MTSMNDLIAKLSRKRELQLTFNAAKEELKTMHYKDIAESCGRTHGSVRYFARKLNLTSGKAES